MVFLAFADGAVVRLEVECLEAELRDVGPRAPGQRMPRPRADQRRADLNRRSAEIVMAVILDANAAGFRSRDSPRCSTPSARSAADVDAAVAAIIADVRARGDAALAEYSLRFDRVDLSRSGLRISAERKIDAAVAACDPEALEALEFAHERVLAYHRRQTPERRRVRRRARRRTRLALARRSTRSASTCPAARRAIRPR